MKSTYRSLIGSIGFCATAVRYDIAFAVSVLSRHHDLARPNTKLISAAKRAIQYLKRTRNFGIEYVVLCSMVCEVKSLQSLMAELGFPQEPTLIWEDNSATIMILRMIQRRQV